MNPKITGILFASIKVFLPIFLLAFYIGFIQSRYESERLLAAVLTGLIFALPVTFIYALWELSWAILGQARAKQHVVTQSPAAASVTISEKLKTGLKFNSWLVIIPVLLIAPFAKEFGKDFANWIYSAPIDGDPVSRLIETPFGKYSWTGPTPPTQAEIDELTAIVTGNAYWYGNGIPQDQAKAIPFYLKASGSPEAQYNLGIAYYSGIGVQKNYATAVDWFRKAAVQGLAEAQYMLGMHYWIGDGVPQDYGKSAEWLRKAAEQGVAEAQGRLGLAYWLGRAVPADYALAYMWLNLSAAQGYDWAISTREDLLRYMTSQQVVEGQRLTRERLALNPSLLNNTR